MKRIFNLFAFLLIINILVAQSPKRELRATWLATVWRLDWPSATVPANGTETARQNAINIQKNGLISILDKLQESNVNAAFFQVRSMCEAMYQSSYEPWSQYISSERGADPGWDPLAFAIDEAHKRGIELHAWLNPYRYSSSEATHGNLPTDYANTHPEWLMDYGGYAKILNPGIPAVIERITDIVEEIVLNYDVDGIVFDDYFYMQGTTDNMDMTQYNAYNPNNLARGDWRRANVNKMIKNVYNKIQSINPEILFGVSPAGVAASSAEVAGKYGVPPSPVGSDWQYNGIYSDPLAWLSEGSIDYISPQLYWTTSSSNAYDKLAPWWSNVANKFGKHFYSSHSLSAMTGPDPSSGMENMMFILMDEEVVSVNALSSLERSLIDEITTSKPIQKTASEANYYFSELGLQIDWNRNSDINGAPGSVFYSTKKAVGSQFVDYLKETKYACASLRPAVGWKKAESQTLVDNLSLSGKTLSWTYNNDKMRYAIYAIPKSLGNQNDVFASSEYLLGISYSKQYTLPNEISADSHKIAVSIVDRYANEFSPRVLGENLVSGTPTTLIYPSNGISMVIPTIFRWNEVSDAISYVIEIALDPDFKQMFAARETTEAQFFSGLLTNMQENIKYYWRVKTRQPNAVESYSEIFNFTGTKFKILKPTDGSENISLTPTFEWISTASSNYTLEIAISNKFIESQIEYRNSTDATSMTVPEKTLVTGRTYYARVIASGGVNAITETISFTMEKKEIPVPVLISPENDATIKGESIEVCWEEQISKGFRVELSQSQDFPPRNTKAKAVDINTFCTSYDDLEPGVYYVRVKALNESGLTESSNVSKINLEQTTAIDEILDKDNIYVFKENGKSILNINTDRPSTITVNIYSTSGLLISKMEDVLSQGLNSFILDTENLSKGIYLIKIKMDNKQKIIKLQN